MVYVSKQTIFLDLSDEVYWEYGEGVKYLGAHNLIIGMEWGFIFERSEKGHLVATFFYLIIICSFQNITEPLILFFLPNWMKMRWMTGHMVFKVSVSLTSN